MCATPLVPFLCDVVRECQDSSRFSHTNPQKMSLSMLCNLAAYEACRHSLIANEVVPLLASMVTMQGYAGMRATMGLACLIGRQEDKESKLLVAQPHVIEPLIQLLTATLQNRSNGFGTVFSVDEVLLPLQALSISDNNKPLLGSPQMVQQLLHVIERAGASEKSVDLASATLLELSFNEAVAAILKAQDFEAQR